MASTVILPGSRVEARQDNKLDKVHRRKPRGGRSTGTEDYPTELSPYTLRSANRIEHQAAALGPAVAAFARRLLPWTMLRQRPKLLRL